LSGCPSLTVKPNPDPLKRQPISYVDNTCVGCGNCGEVAHEAVLCPSFYKADLILNPNKLDRFIDDWRRRFIGWLQKRANDRRLKAA
jgi:indolepyruvate ferredoxin oxidoreductase alpha subunit